MSFQKFIFNQGIRESQNEFTYRRILTGVTFGVNLGRYLSDRQRTESEFNEVIDFLISQNMLRSMMRPGSTYIREITSIVSRRPFVGSVLHRLNKGISSEEDSDTPGVTTPSEDEDDSESHGQGTTPTRESFSPQDGKGKGRMTDEEVKREADKANALRTEHIRRETAEAAKLAELERQRREAEKAAAERLFRQKASNAKAPSNAKQQPAPARSMSAQAEELLRKVREQAEQQRRYEEAQEAERAARANEFKRAREQEQARRQQAEREATLQAEDKKRQEEKRTQDEWDAKMDAQRESEQARILTQINLDWATFYARWENATPEVLKRERQTIADNVRDLIGLDSATHRRKYPDADAALRTFRVQLKVILRIVETRKLDLSK